MASYDSTRKDFTIAVVGGGIGGLALTIGLLHQGVSVQVYESAPAFAEIGAGIAFGPNAIRAMALIDPAISTAFTSRATKNGAKEEEETWINFRCGLGEPKLIAKVQTADQAKTGLSSVHRARFMDDLASLIPEGIAHFGKRLLNLEQKESGKIELIFEDQTRAEADAVVGCDGVRSRVRQILFNRPSPLEDLTFSGKYAYRGLIPMDQAREALGEYLAENSQMYLGPEGHILTYPIERGKIMNVVAFKNQDTPWTDESWVIKNQGAAMKRDFASWAQPVQSILKLMNAPDKWALFDHRPAPTYHQGRIAILGDAAHASTPHQGAGAGQALEDALVLSALLGDPRVRAPADLPAALAAYDAVRRPRSQRVVTTSRAAGRVYAFQGPAGADVARIGADLVARCRWIWDEDVGAQVRWARSLLDGRLGTLRVEGGRGSGAGVGGAGSGGRRTYIWVSKAMQDFVSWVRLFFQGGVRW